MAVHILGVAGSVEYTHRQPVEGSIIKPDQVVAVSPDYANNLPQIEDISYDRPCLQFEQANR